VSVTHPQTNKGSSMKRRTAFAGVAGASSLLAVAALVSPVVTSAATPTTQTGASASISITKPANAPAPRAAARRLTSMQAQAIVLKQAHGGRVSDVRGMRHGGYDSFAVRLTQPDGSHLTGYIDRHSGVVFDWKQTSAPASTNAAPSSTTSDDDTQSADDNGSEQGDDTEAESEDINDDHGTVNDDQDDHEDQSGDDISEHDD
jgi:hypothetical protein